MSEWLKQIVEPFRFIKHARERRFQQELQLREHTIELIDTVLSRVEAQSATHANAVVELARASQAHAEALKVWFEMFQASNDVAHLTTSTVRPQDQWAEEQTRDQERLIAAGYPVNKDPAEQLAWLQSQGGMLPI